MDSNGPSGFSCVFMRSFGILMGPYASSSFLMISYTFLLVLMRPCRCLCVLIDSNLSL